MEVRHANKANKPLDRDRKPKAKWRAEDMIGRTEHRTTLTKDAEDKDRTALTSLPYIHTKTIILPFSE